MFGFGETFWTGDRYWHPGVANDSPSAIRTYPMPCAATWSHLLAEVDAAAGVGKTRSVAIHRAGVATSLIAAFGAADVRASNLVDSAHFVAGEITGIKTSTAGAPAFDDWRHSVICEPDIDGLIPFFGAAWSSPAGWAIFVGINGGEASAGGGHTEIRAQTIVPVPGKFKHFYGYSEGGAVPAGNALTYAFRLNGVPTALNLAFAPGDTLVSDVVTEVPVVAGDLVNIILTQTAGAWTGHITHGICFIPDDPSYYWLSRPFNFDGLLLGAAVEYSLPTCGKIHTGDHWNAVERPTRWPSGPDIRGLYVRLGAAPGVGATRTFTVRVNGVDTPITLTIAGAATTDYATGLVEPGDWDSVTISTAATGAPAASGGSFALYGTDRVVTVTAVVPASAERGTK